MSRITTLITIILLSWGGASAQFAVKAKGGTTQRLTDSGEFVREATARSGYSFGGTDIADIREISVSSLSQDEAGTTLTLPDGLKAQKPAVILDITGAVSEIEAEKRNLYSCEYMLQIAGMPYRVTKSLQEAVEGSSMILLTSQPKKATFSESDIDMLKEYVASGSLLFSPNIGSTAPASLKDLFGVSAVSVHSKKSKRSLCWTSDTHPELVYVDEPEEQATALGAINVSVLTPSTGEALAFSDGDASMPIVVKNSVGKCAAYLFGLLWRDVVQRPQLDKDMETGRGKSNTFEPSADMYPLFIRAAYVASLPAAAWKFTVPEGYTSVLIPTHDCDSRTAYEAMHYMADYEKSLGLRGHYFLTVHYFSQPGYLSAFYNDETIPAAKALLEDGHTVGSHSICHYPDFGSYKDAELRERFPLKEYDRDGYAAYASHDINTKTSYGSTWAELVLSKRIIEEDLGNKVRSFRSGHLCVNSLMPEAHRIAGYNFSSCYTATSVHSQFPFIQRMTNDWSGEPTGVLQIPLHFSDVFSAESMSEANYKEKAAIWVELFNKLKGNFASSVILIHPNREWKMLAQKILVENMDLADCGLYNFEDYGDFWLAREAFDFDSFIIEAEKKLILRASAADIAANPALAIMVEVPSGDIENITLVDENNKVHPVRIRRLDEGRYLVIL